jgi:hypothetical protein
MWTAAALIRQWFSKDCRRGLQCYQTYSEVDAATEQAGMPHPPQPPVSCTAHLGGARGAVQAVTRVTRATPTPLLCHPVLKVACLQLQVQYILHEAVQRGHVCLAPYRPGPAAGRTMVIWVTGLPPQAEPTGCWKDPACECALAPLGIQVHRRASGSSGHLSFSTSNMMQTHHRWLMFSCRICCESPAFRPA